MITLIRPNILVIVILLLGTISKVQAQDNARLAESLFQKKDFQKAALLYEDLHEEKPENSTYYENYLQCLINIKEFKKARKTTRRMAKITGYPLIFMIDECWVNQQEDPDNKSNNKLYRLILEKAQDNISLALQAADRFQSRDMTDEAIDILTQTENIYGSNPRLSNQIALLEMQNGKRLKALDRYLDLIVRANASHDQLKRIFDTYITDSADVMALQDMLLVKIKQHPQVTGLSEWLKWTFVQLQDWNKAFIYTRSLDLRLKEDGYRMFELSFLCATNGDLKTAIQCLEYCIKKGEDAYNYYEAQSRWFELSYQYAEQENLPLSQNFDNQIFAFISNNAPSKSTLPSAIIWSKRLTQKNLTDSAIAVLSNFTKSEYLDKKTTAEAKIALSDLLIQNGDVYKSELLLAQVEKQFKDDPIGQMAKFKRAELSFYRGDYDWANMQLDVLKGATTQLISNDAMELSLCITDNLGIDSNYTALEWYSRARLFQRQKQSDSAFYYIEKIAQSFPSHSLGDEIMLMKAQLYEEKGDYTEAADIYDKLVDIYPNDILADNALFALAQIQQFQLKETGKAKINYEKLIVNYTQSLFVAEARIQFRKLRGF